MAFPHTFAARSGAIPTSELDANFAALEDTGESNKGAGLVKFLQAGTSAQPRTVQSKLRDVISVKDFGAVGDGIADDYSAFSAALTAAAGGLVYVPKPSASYLIGTGTLTIPTGTALVGDSPKTTHLKHGFNGDMFIVGEGASIENLFLDGNGAVFTGRCMVFQNTDGRQNIINVRATDWDGAVQEFAVAAGSQSYTGNCRFARRNAGTGTGRFAIVVSPTQQLSSIPRTFVGVQTDGTCAFDFGGCNSVYITNSFLADINYTADTRAVLITNTRIANMAALTIRGFNNTVVGCAISPQITIASGSDNIAIQGNSYNALPVIDNSGNSRNLIDYWVQSYTPALTSGGTAPSIGNGSISGQHSRSGGSITVQGELTLGSTTSLGSGGLSISLPLTYQNSAVFTGGTVVMNRGGTIYEGFLQIAGAGATTAELLRDTTGPITFNSPGTFASGDTIRWSATYNQ